MTVYESLANWLNDILNDPKNEFPENMETVIDLETLPESSEHQNTALFSSPNDIQEQMLGGQVRKTVFKIWYIKKPFKERPDRLENERFFEKLRKAIYKKNLSGAMPKDGRKWRSVEYQGGIYPAQRQENEDYAVYPVNIKLIYEG
jgi:hypothetical protein